jgi:signal peptidase
MSASRPSHVIAVIFKIIVIGLLSAILAGNLYIIAVQLAGQDRLPKLFGYAQIIVISGSMKPDIEAGDLIIIKEQQEYRDGDVVTYRSGPVLITHRIIAINESGIITKGDANNAADEPVLLSDIEGKVVLRIPGAGNFVIFLKSPQGILIISCLALFLYGLSRTVQKLKRGKERE